MNEPTPWEEINPPMVSARRSELQTQSSGELTPATNEHFKLELTSCLALVAPAGMSEENRRDWLAVAWQTLKHLPPDLLSRGCAIARQKCDHPAKIVPAILEATADSMSWRHKKAGGSYREPERLPPPDYCTPDEAKEILRQFGFKGVASKAT